jgi:hypothetical protein
LIRNAQSINKENQLEICNSFSEGSLVHAPPLAETHKIAPTTFYELSAKANQTKFTSLEQTMNSSFCNPTENISSNPSSSQEYANSQNNSRGRAGFNPASSNEESYLASYKKSLRRRSLDKSKSMHSFNMAKGSGLLLGIFGREELMNDQEETLALKISEQVSKLYSGFELDYLIEKEKPAPPVPTCPISSVAVFLKTHKQSATELQPAQQLPRGAPKRATNLEMNEILNKYETSYLQIITILLIRLKQNYLQ